jgi:DNA repair protein RadA/Sms
LTRKKAFNPPQELSKVNSGTVNRMKLTLDEFNRVLGGGLTMGSLVLIGGEPGIGKSTLLLQVAANIASLEDCVIYVSGEETASQVKQRAHRLGLKGEGLYILSETDLDVILSQVDGLSPRLLVVDSIQTVYLPELETAPGSMTQVREATQRLMGWAKTTGVPVLISGHVTKDGAIAGPRLLEHIVDTVLYLEGEPFSAYRLLRGVKNRFGSVNEVGIFEMGAEGLVEVKNPSKLFLSRRPEEAIGAVVVSALEGSRPLLVEIQALTSLTTFGQPRRNVNGVDFGRLIMIAAVLSKRLGFKLGSQDIIVSVTGGIKVTEPAADLAIALAIASSFRNTAVASDLVALGEISLSGELRPVSQLERRLGEAARLGFRRCLVPKIRSSKGIAPEGIELIQLATLKEAVKEGMIAKVGLDDV